MEGMEHCDDLIFVGEEDKKLPLIKTVFQIRKDLIEKAVESVKAAKLQKKYVKHALFNCDLNDTDDFKNAPAHKNSKLKLKTFSAVKSKNISVKDVSSNVGEIISISSEGQTSVVSKNKLSFGTSDLKLSCVDQLKSCHICGSIFEIKELESHVLSCLKSKFSKNPVPIKKISPYDTDKKESIFCSICKKNLSHLNSQRQTYHINKCMEKMETFKENDTKHQELLETAKKAVLNCPMCGKKLKTLLSRQSHLKKCAASNKMSAEQVKNMVKQQDEEHMSKLDAGILPEEFLDKSKSRTSKPFKSKIPIDEEMQLAMALSRSLADENDEYDKFTLESHDSDSGKLKLMADEQKMSEKGQDRNKRGKQVNTSSLLFSLSKEKALERLSRRVDKYIFSKICESNTSHTPPFKIQSINNDVMKYADLSDNRFWSLTSLSSIEACHRSEFYVQKLIPPISVSCVETGSKLKRVSIIPGRRKSVEDQQEEQDYEGTSDSQTLEILTHLAKESEVNEQEEAGINILQRCHSTSAITKQSDNTKSGLEDNNSSGFYPETSLVSQKSCTTSLQESYLSLVNNQYFSDVVILTRDRKLFAHRVVLHARCSKLLNMVQCHGDTNIIDLTSFLEDSVLSVLKFIYADLFSLSESNASDIVKLSSLLELKKLASTALSYCVTTNIGHTNLEKNICLNNNEYEDKTDWPGIDDNDWKDIFHSQRKNLNKKPTPEDLDVSSNFKITFPEIERDAHITVGNVSKTEGKLNIVSESKSSDDCDQMPNDIIKSDHQSVSQKILKKKNCVHDIGPVVNSPISDAVNTNNISGKNDDKLLTSDISLNPLIISSPSAIKITNADKINSSFSNDKLVNIICGNKTTEKMVEENNVIKAIENDLSTSVLSDQMLDQNSDFEVINRNDMTLDNTPLEECFRMLGQDCKKTDQEKDKDPNSGNDISKTSSGDILTPSHDRNVCLRKKKRKKVSKKDFQNIVSKIISKSVEGQQSLSELLSADDVANIAVKIEQDFMAIYQDADANDSVYFPCILDQVDVDTDDIMITFADIKDPINKKCRSRKITKPTSSKGDKIKSPVLSFRKLQKCTKSKLSSSYVLSDPDKSVIDSKNSQFSVEHLTSNVSDTIKIPYQLPIADSETRPSVNRTSIIDMNLTNISKEITQQLTDACIYKKLHNSSTHLQYSDSDTSWLIDQTVTSTSFPQSSHEKSSHETNDHSLPQTVHCSVINLHNSKNHCISDDELFSDSDQNSPASFPHQLKKKDADFKSTLDSHWSLSTLPISSSPLYSNRELRIEAGKHNSEKQTQHHNRLSPKGKEASLKEKMFNIISDVVINHMIPSDTKKLTLVDNSSVRLTFGSNHSKLSHVTTPTSSVAERKSQISETTIINAKQVQQINNHPIKNGEYSLVPDESSKNTDNSTKYKQNSKEITEYSEYETVGAKNVPNINIHSFAHKNIGESIVSPEGIKESSQIKGNSSVETESGAISTAENMKNIKVQSDSPKTIMSLKPSIYLKNADIETDKLTTSQLSLIKPNTLDSTVTSKHVAKVTEEKSKKNGSNMINSCFSSPLINNQQKDHSFNSMDIPVIKTSPLITDLEKSPLKTRRGLAKKNSPLLMSSTVLNKSSETQSESWLPSPVLSNSSHDIIEMNQVNSIQKNRLFAYGSKNDNLEFEKNCFSHSNSLLPKYFVSDFNNPTSSEFQSQDKCQLSPDIICRMSENLASPTQVSVTENNKIKLNNNFTFGVIKIKKENLQEEEPLPSDAAIERLTSCNDHHHQNVLSQNITFKSLPLNNNVNTERQLTLSNAIDLASPLPLRQRLGLQNTKMSTKVGIAAEKDSVAMFKSLSQAKEEKFDRIFEDSFNISEIEAVTSPSKDPNKNGNFMIGPEKFNCKTPINQKIGKHKKKNAGKEPSPFTPMPHFDEMTTPDLTKAASKIGVRPVGKKRLRELLKHVYHATHQYETDSDYDGTPVKHPRIEIMSTNENETKQKFNRANMKINVKRNSSKVTSEEKCIISSIVNQNDQNVKNASKNVKHCEQKPQNFASEVEENNVFILSQDSSYSDCPEESILQSWTEEESPLEPHNQINSETPVQRLAQFMTENKDIYHSILMYEPLELDILKKRLTDFGIKISMEKVMDFLDERCITFTMKNLNKGHNRHQRRQRPKKSPKKRTKQ